MRVSMIVVLLALALASACAAKLQTHDKSGGEGNSKGHPQELEFTGDKSGNFTSRARGDGLTETQADATSETDWQYFDFDTGGASKADGDWDIAFSRFRIKTNGGENGPGGVYVAGLPEQSFEELTRAPIEGFAADRPDSDEDTDTDPDNVFNSGDEDWYNYNVMLHELSPKDISYVIASTEGAFFKFVIDRYYDSAGTPAVFRFRWAEIEAPDGDWKPE